eukprot:GHVT01103950.1.p1 GENE.GHVT01103950.1~~GHVT01103950.1.p1  ORF type:complete len:273 (-),score=26.13 GHVT01103950.1:1639-2457(-)
MKNSLGKSASFTNSGSSNAKKTEIKVNIDPPDSSSHSRFFHLGAPRGVPFSLPVVGVGLIACATLVGVSMLSLPDTGSLNSSFVIKSQPIPPPSVAHDDTRDSPFHPLITGDVPKFLERWGGAAENRGAVQSLSGLSPAVVEVGRQFAQKQGWTLTAECLSTHPLSSSDFTQGSVSTGRRLTSLRTNCQKLILGFFWAMGIGTTVGNPITGVVTTNQPKPATATATGTGWLSEHTALVVVCVTVIVFIALAIFIYPYLDNKCDPKKQVKRRG